ncbi:hypothetical protein ACUC2M_06730 [Bacillus cytotoxicus]
MDNDWNCRIHYRYPIFSESQCFYGGKSSLATSALKEADRFVIYHLKAHYGKKNEGKLE